jgi:4-aminobutyrate aminotransferase
MGSHLADVWFQVTDLDVVSGSGSTVTTADGTEYLDFTAGIAVVSTGHCHPRVVAAIQEQAAKLIHAQVNCYRHPLLEQLGERLAGIAPDGIDTFFYANSGAEATEAAVKLAKQATGRPNVIVFSGSFHGRSHLTMAMTTSKHGYRAGYQPLPGGVFVAPFPHPWAEGRSAEESVERALTEVHRLLLAQTAPAETAAMVIEPVLGEGGYIPAPASFLQGLDAICREHGILFVADEVQTGFGRTGTMFAIEQAGIVPDVVVMAKGLASGFPISAIGASAELMAKWPKGSHGGTYGGNPIGCAAALATIDVLTEPGFLDQVNARGDQLRRGLGRVVADHGLSAEVRGPGLMVGLELGDPAAGTHDTARIGRVIAHCRDESRLLLMNAGTYGNVVRFMAPLVVTEAEITRALAALDTAFGSTS